MQHDVYDRFSFTQLNATGEYVWFPYRSGDWAVDNDTGQRYADELHHYIIAESVPFMLGYIVKMIIAHGRFSGVEVAFFDRLATYMFTPSNKIRDN